MIELELSLMEYPGSNSEECIRPLLDQFERQHNCQIRVRLIPWGTGWSKLPWTVRVPMFLKSERPGARVSYRCDHYVRLPREKLPHTEAILLFFHRPGKAAR